VTVYSLDATRPLRAVGAPTATAVEALTSAVASEVRLLEDLIGIMRRQRNAVASDDLQGVDDSVFATHRVLVTLAEARRRRRALNQLVAGTEDVPLRSIEEHLGERMTDELRFARDGLHAAALTLSKEVETNRHVLREAIASGSEYVRSIYGAADPHASYAPAARPEPETAGGLLLNRRA
jgi:hypothetical protein